MRALSNRIQQKSAGAVTSVIERHRRAIGWRLEVARDNLKGDVLKLQAKGNHYRLRVGNFRILFLLASDAIQVYAVKDRKEAYE